MSLPQVVIDTAKKLQADYNLDDCDLPMILMHDYIHATLGVGFTTDEEDLVSRIEVCLEGGTTWDAKAVEMAASLPEFFRVLYTQWTTYATKWIFQNGGILFLLRLYIGKASLFCSL